METFRFVFIFIFICLSYGDKADHNCVFNKMTKVLDCTKRIPRSVPSGTHSVRVIEVKEQFDNRTFLDTSWKAVKQLTIQGRENQNLLDFTFQPLSNLTYLQISFSYTYHVQARTFYGLDGLQTLDMSNCYRLSFWDFNQVMKDMNNFPRLNVLKIDQMENYFNSDDSGVVLNRTFFEYVGDRNITELSVDYTRIVAMELNFPKSLCSSLRQFSAKYTTFLDFRQLPLVCSSVTYVDMSGVKVWYPLKGETLENVVHHPSGFFFKLSIYFPSIATFRLDNFSVISESVYKNITFILKDVAKPSLKEFSFQGNMMVYLDLVFVGNFFSRIERFHIQNNKMQFVSQRFWLAFASITFVNVSNNELYKMENNTDCQLSEMFRYASGLKIIDLSGNKLTTLPKKMLTINKNLTRLHLRDNAIKTFELLDASKLEFLDLQSNLIDCIDGANRNIIDTVLKRTNGKFRINLHNNPLNCSCEKLDFLKWFIKSPVFRVDNSEFKCLYDEKYQILDEQLVYDIDGKCEQVRRTKRIVITTSVIVAILIPLTVVSFLVLRRIHRRRKRKIRIHRAVQALNENTLEYEIPIFISFNDNDLVVVTQHIVDPINDQLRQITGSDDRNFVFTGDELFRPGFPIKSEEIPRCFDLSAIVLVVVTPEYCESRYCRSEIQKAVEMDKHVVLLFLVHVNEEDMPPSMRSVFRRSVRINMARQDDGQYQIIPSWDVVCHSLLELMGY